MSLLHVLIGSLINMSAGEIKIIIGVVLVFLIGMTLVSLWLIWIIRKAREK